MGQKHYCNIWRDRLPKREGKSGDTEEWANYQYATKKNVVLYSMTCQACLHIEGWQSTDSCPSFPVGNVYLSSAVANYPILAEVTIGQGTAITRCGLSFGVFNKELHIVSKIGVGYVFSVGHLSEYYGWQCGKQSNN